MTANTSKLRNPTYRSRLRSSGAISYPEPTFMGFRLLKLSNDPYQGVRAGDMVTVRAGALTELNGEIGRSRGIQPVIVDRVLPMTCARIATVPSGGRPPRVPSIFGAQLEDESLFGALEPAFLRRVGLATPGSGTSYTHVMDAPSIPEGGHVERLSDWLDAGTIAALAIAGRIRYSRTPSGQKWSIYLVDPARVFWRAGPSGNSWRQALAADCFPTFE